MPGSGSDPARLTIPFDAFTAPDFGDHSYSYSIDDGTHWSLMVTVGEFETAHGQLLVAYRYDGSELH